jgi:hypothetical protein
MRFSILSALYLVSFTVAAPVDIQRQDKDVIKRNMKIIGDSVKALDSTLSAKPKAKADPRDVEDFFARALKAHGIASDDMRIGAEEIRRAPSLNAFDATAIVAGSFNPLDVFLTRIINNWISVKRDADFIGAKDDVRRILEESRYQSNTFYDVLIGKFPVSMSTSAKNSRSRTDALLLKAISEYRR